jgi:hypothetical protein
MALTLTYPDLSDTIVKDELQSNFDDIISKFGAAFTSDDLASDSVTTAKIEDDAVTLAKIADNTLDGTVLANVADANVIGGIPVVHRIEIADGAGDTDVTLTHTTLITDVHVYKTSASGASGDTITVKNGATAITDALDIGVSDTVVVRAGQIDDAANKISAAGTLRVTAANNTNNACVVIVQGLRVAT